MNKFLSSLFIKGFHIKNPFSLKNTENIDKFNGKKFPTHFTIEKPSSLSNPKKCPINQKSFRISFKTDVVNDYFDRETDNGKHQLTINGNQHTGSKSMNLWNGNAILNVEIDSSMSVGDIFHFSSIISDVQHIQPFENDFYLEIIEAVEIKPKNTKGKRKKPSNNKPGNNQKNTDDLALPNIVEIFKNDKNWMGKDFNDYSALLTEYNGDELGYTFFVNADNIHLKTEQKNNFKVDSNILKAQYKYSLVLMGMSMIKAGEDNYLKETEEIDINKMISMFTTSISPVILPLLSSLGELTEIDSEPELTLF